MVAIRGNDGTAVFCDCCGKEKLAEIEPGRMLEIMDQRHGKKHIAVLSPGQLLQRISGTMEPNAILIVVQRMIASLQ